MKTSSATKNVRQKFLTSVDHVEGQPVIRKGESRESVAQLRLVSLLVRQKPDLLTPSHTPTAPSSATGLPSTMVVYHACFRVALPSLIECLLVLLFRRAQTRGEDNQIRMWDLRTRRCKVIFTGHSKAITCLTALREDGSNLVLSGAKVVNSLFVACERAPPEDLLLSGLCAPELPHCRLYTS